MRVIQTADVVSGDETLLESFQRNLTRQDLSGATCRHYLHDLKLFRDWLIWLHEGKKVSLTEVNPVDLAAFRKHLIQEKGHKPSTVNRRVQSLRLFYRWLSRQGHIVQDPAERLRFMRRETRRQPQALRRREVLALVNAAGASPRGLALRNTALIQLMLQTGLRVGEVAALRREDVVIKDRSGVVRVREGKGMKSREVPLNLSARKALSAYCEARGKMSPKAFVFVNKQTHPLSIRGVQSIVTTLAKRAGINRIKVSAHTLRHTFALHYLKSHPGKLVELASLLGHDSLDTTAVYTQPAREDLADDLETSALNVLGE